MKLISQLTKFGGIGIFLAVISIGIYYVTLDVLQWPLYPTYICVYLIAVFISYMLNSKYTFGANRTFKALLQYYGVYIIGLGFGLFLLFLGRNYLTISNFWLTIATIIPRTLFIFVLSKLLVFKPEM